MIVRCIANSPESLHSAEDLASYQAYVRSAEVYLLLGHHYFVYGIAYRLGVPWFLVCEELEDEYPKPHIAAFFEVVDHRLPPGWVYRDIEGQFGKTEMLPASWVRDRCYPEQLIDGVPEAVAAFRTLQAELAVWHGDSASLLGKKGLWRMKARDKMNGEKCFRKFGVRIWPDQAGQIREILQAEAQLEERKAGGDTDLMRLCAVQLFGLGLEEDVLRIFEAKMSSMDAQVSIEIPLVCGPGIAATKAYLEKEGSPLALWALTKIKDAEVHGMTEPNREEVLAASEDYFGGG